MHHMPESYSRPEPGRPNETIFPSRRNPPETKKAPLGLMLPFGDQQISKSRLGRPQIAANDNELAWPFIPFPEGWYSA
jgi:hypothetical protein